MQKDELDYFGQSIRDSLGMILWTMVGTVWVFGIFLVLFI